MTTILPVSGYKIACPGNLPWQLIKHRHSTHLHVHFVTYCPDHLIKARSGMKARPPGEGARCAPSTTWRCHCRGSVINVTEGEHQEPRGGG